MKSHFLPSILKDDATVGRNDAARHAFRYLWFGMLILIVISSSLLGYGLARTAESTARHVGQLEANLLAEGEAERLNLSFEDGVNRVPRAQVEQVLTALGNNWPEVRSLTLLDPDQRVIATYTNPQPVAGKPGDRGWHAATGRLEATAGRHSQLLLSLYRERETRLSGGKILVVFVAFAAVWAVLSLFLLRRFCHAWIEAPALRLGRLQAMLRPQQVSAQSSGLWREAIQAELAKQEQLEKLLQSVQWRAEALCARLPAREAEVRDVLRSLADVLPEQDKTRR